MKTKSAALQIIIPQFRMHTQLFDNVLHGISDTDASSRINGKTNHITWMAGNLVNARYWLGNLLGIEKEDPNSHLFKDAKALDPNADYPSLNALKSEWHVISPLVFEKLQNVTDEELSQPFSMGMNIDFVEENKFNMTGMAIDRESYLLGQLALMRRALGYDSMKYDFNKAINY